MLLGQLKSMILCQNMTTIELPVSALYFKYLSDARTDARRFCSWWNLNSDGIQRWRTRVQTDGRSSLIVDHFGGTIGGGRFARRIVTLELTSFARSGSAVNETPRTERRAGEEEGGGRGGEKWRKTEKRNKGPIKTNWFSSPRPFVHRSTRRRARSVRQILWSFCTHTYTHTHVRTRAHTHVYIDANTCAI